MSKNETRKPVSQPDAQEVERNYGDFAEEYAKVRADAAEASGSPASGKWEEVEQELGQHRDRAD
jgi:hypothetical protein